MMTKEEEMIYGTLPINKDEEVECSHFFALKKKYYKGGTMTFEIYKDKKNEWRWRLKAKNGKIIAQGESYKRKKAMLKTISSITDTFRFGYLSVKIVDVENPE